MGRRHSISNKPSTIAQRERKTAGETKVARRHSISYKPSSSEQLERKTVGRRQLITGEQTLVKQEKNVRRHSISDKPSAFAQKEREICWLFIAVDFSRTPKGRPARPQ